MRVCVRTQATQSPVPAEDFAFYALDAAFVLSSLHDRLPARADAVPAMMLTLPTPEIRAPAFFGGSVFGGSSRECCDGCDGSRGDEGLFGYGGACACCGEDDARDGDGDGELLEVPAVDARGLGIGCGAGVSSSPRSELEHAGGAGSVRSALVSALDLGLAGEMGTGASVMKLRYRDGGYGTRSGTGLGAGTGGNPARGHEDPERRLQAVERARQGARSVFRPSGALWRRFRRFLGRRARSGSGSGSGSRRAWRASSASAEPLLGGV